MKIIIKIVIYIQSKLKKQLQMLEKWPLSLSSYTATIKQALSFKQYDHQHRIRVITLSSCLSNWSARKRKNCVYSIFLQLTIMVLFISSLMFLLFLFKTVFMCMYLFLCVYGHLSATLSQKRTFDFPLELELPVVVSHLTWTLGTELKSSGKAASALNC